MAKRPTISQKKTEDKEREELEQNTPDNVDLSENEEDVVETEADGQQSIQADLAEAARNEDDPNIAEAAKNETVEEPDLVSEEDKAREEEEAEDVPAWNGNGHRCAYVNDRGEITEIDEDTAKVLYENPKYYNDLFDQGRQKRMPVNMFRWLNEDGTQSELVVGERYERKQ